MCPGHFLIHTAYPYPVGQPSRNSRVPSQSPTTELSLLGERDKKTSKIGFRVLKLTDSSSLPHPTSGEHTQSARKYSGDTPTPDALTGLPNILLDECTRILSDSPLACHLGRGARKHTLFKRRARRRVALLAPALSPGCAASICRAPRLCLAADFGVKIFQLSF